MQRGYAAGCAWVAAQPLGVSSASRWIEASLSPGRTAARYSRTGIDAGAGPSGIVGGEVLVAHQGSQVQWNDYAELHITNSAAYGARTR
jgi:hypothetical protein